MIREFIEDDLSRIKLNDFGDGDLIKKLMPAIKICEGWTLEKDGVVKAILFYRNYAEKNYEGFLVCSMTMNAFDGQEIKEFIYKLRERLDIKRIETLSLDCEELNKWHKFLGFECEGTKRKFLKNKDYKMWAIVAQEA
jgi:hypothetical protein